MSLEYISTTETASILGISTQRVSQLIGSGQLEAQRLGGRWLVDSKSVEARRFTASKKGGRPRTGKGRDDMEFMLMNRTHEIAKVVYNRKRRAFTNIGAFHDKERAPIGVFGQRNVSDAASLDAWWRGRGIPGTRIGIQRILDEAKVDVPEELVMHNLGLSLSDHYWIRPEGSGLAWEDINFFNNSIEKVSAATENYSPVATLASVHPDNTSDGNLPKQWVVRRGKRILLKGGGPNNQEPYNELVATALHKRMLKRADFVPYTLENAGEEALCACENILSDEEEYVPALYVKRMLTEQNNRDEYQHYVQCCHNMGIEGIELALWKMIVCDDIIANSDRHFRNFGVIRNVETLACRPAPIFDSGSCLWVNTPLHDLKQGEFSFQGKQFDPNPARQLLFVEDMSWFKGSALSGFADEAIGILATNPLLEKRLPYIHTSLERRIARIIDIREWS